MNADFEDGLTHWAVLGDNNCKVNLAADPADANDTIARVYDRTRSDTGIEQDLTQSLLDHGPGLYTYSASVRTECGTFPIHLGLRIVDSDGTHYHPSPAVEAESLSWRKATRTHDLSWNGLQGAWLYIESQAGHNGVYYVDDCAVLRHP